MRWARSRTLTHGLGADLTLDTSGRRPAPVGGACVRTWGTVCFVGEGDSVTLDVSPDMLRKQLTIIGSWTFSTIGQAECARFIADAGSPSTFLYTSLAARAGRGGVSAVRRQTGGKGVIAPAA